MKKLLFIGLLIFQFALSSAQTGFNLVFPKVIDLMEATEARNTLVKELQKLSPEEKILRYIGGNEGTNLGYLPKVNEFFIDFCKDAGVQEIYLRVEIDDFETGLKNYIDITSSGLTINYIDFGNEDYFNVKKEGNWWEKLFWGNPKIRQNVTKRAAENYAKEFVNFLNYAYKNGYDFTELLVWNTHFKNDAINRTWHNTLKTKLPTHKICTIHIYGELSKDYWTSTLFEINENFKGLEITVGEYYPLGFHNLKDWEKEVYKGSEKEYLMDVSCQLLMDQIDSKVRLKHTLFHWDNYKSYYQEFTLNKKTGQLKN